MKTFQNYLDETHEEGEVQEIIHSIVYVSGLPGATISEVIVFEKGQIGQVMALRRDHVEVLLMSRSSVEVGHKAARTGFPLQIQVGLGSLGQVINSLGVVIEGSTIEPGSGEMRPVDSSPLGIAERQKITRTLETGVIMVDLMIPLGMGQRELILGDRKTGKSYLAREIVMHQTSLGNICIYSLIGKKKSEIKKTVEFFRKSGAIKNMIMVVTGSHDSVGEVYLTPYTAMAMAESFRDQGRDVLVVLDDMTTHGKFYRELSLLARKFPGRDSYPGDIFHIHSKLVERAGNFKVSTTPLPPPNLGGGGQQAGGGTVQRSVSITCLPIAEVVGSDLTGYIQTNLMSMTDGHILFDGGLYAAGRRPAINSFLSVTRVGHQTQDKLRRDINQKLFDLLNDYERTQSFLRFGAELGENSRQILSLGEKVIKFFDQPLHQAVPLNLAIVLLALLWNGSWNGQSADKIITAYTTDQDTQTKYNNVLQNITEFPQLIDVVRRDAEILLAAIK